MRPALGLLAELGTVRSPLCADGEVDRLPKVLDSVV